ncbi:MAG: MerR family transcriptional regulator [Euzebyaceae bacterium]|nr:MerR family transcriptional regulator [Euzebyaceae bacterium]
MSWSIAGLARISGVSPRTLCHYDAIGLLAPAWVAGNGWRHYEQEQLLRLQQILLMQNLGLGLRSVAEIPETRQPRTARSRSCDASVAGSSGAGAAAAPGAHHRPHDRRRSGRRRDARSKFVFEGFEHNPYEARHASGGATTQSTRRTSG